MALPRKLKNLNFFVNGVTYRGVCSELTLPKLTRKTEEYRGAGMSGGIEIDMGQDKIELETVYGGWASELFLAYGTPLTAAVPLRYVGAYQRDDTGEVHAVEIVMRGRHTEIDPGKAKAGDNTEIKVKTSITYLRIVEDGVPVVEIDPVNFVENIYGIDNLAAQRAALSL